MGDYITSADLQPAVGGASYLTQFSDQDRDGSGDTTVLDQAINFAEGLVNGYLNQRFSIPVLATSYLIKQICVQVACFWLSQNQGMGDLEHYSRRYDKAVVLLERLASGSMQLDVATKPTGSELVDSSTIGMVDPEDHEDGGPLWDQEWRDEGGEPGGFWTDE